MATIEKGKSIEFENLLSFRKKLTQAEIGQEINKLGEFIKDNGIRRIGPSITTTFSISAIDGKQIFDMEFMVPIEGAIDAATGYALKPRFRIQNAVYARHEGDPSGLASTYNEVLAFMKDNALQPITTGYNVTVKDISPGMDIKEAIIDVYIGASENIL